MTLGKQARTLSPAEKLDNLTDALVEDILRAPDEEVLLEALGERFERLREERDALKAQLDALAKPTKPMLAAGAQALVKSQAHNGVAQMAVLPAYEVWLAMVSKLSEDKP